MLTEKVYGGEPPLAAMVQPAYAESCVPPGHELVVIANEPLEPVPEDEFDEAFEPQPARPTQANGARTNAQRSSPKERSLRELRPFLRDELAESMRPPLVAANETILSYSTKRKELCPTICTTNLNHTRTGICGVAGRGFKLDKNPSGEFPNDHKRGAADLVAYDHSQRRAVVAVTAGASKRRETPLRAVLTGSGAMQRDLKWALLHYYDILRSI